MYAVPCLLVQLLCQCAEEVGFDWSVQSGDVITARRHLARLQSLDQESALLRSATSATTPHDRGSYMGYAIFYSLTCTCIYM